MAPHSSTLAWKIPWTEEPVNKHKPWIETSYHGVVTENNDTVILDPPLVALDKDAPVPFADYALFGAHIAGFLLFFLNTFTEVLKPQFKEKVKTVFQAD
ncbi:hypothetical protein MG293_000271 [Ovis ammon polii]|uniref:Uncharacterized protein n=1 Tax=Ovis ammon polii TaxID=230172 RepID=A0AAD4UKY3_OVIAM|nr:hypothetical protein MG293_000271 [Ovis ammon polii]